MNKTLLAGLMITAMMIAIGLVGPRLAPYDLEHQAEIKFYINEKGEADLIAPPVPPGALYPLGTDRNGYDLLTKILHGAKYTIFLALGIAFARVALGGVIGLFLGYFGKEAAKKPSGNGYLDVLNGIPLFLIVFFILYGISINPAVSPAALSMIMAVVFLVIGIPSVVATVKEKTAEIRERQFVLASRSLGVGHSRMIGRHLFPHLKESFLILFVNEIIMTLNLFGQLAIFNLFVGGTTMTVDPVEYLSRTNEWAGLIGAARNGIYVYQWILFVPLAFYVTLIVGFYFVSKGLESLYKQKYSKFSHV
ncbi:ABC transporter permease [Paenibacillus sp.]|uniref:ABC transporter permease n=1 Tax=Paenibacillus sp. TaxID=58172 RepID=UPI002D46EE10|nr:ABC transporter permease subunit [Paenibacillus sp.]HZG87624.1 ABC transporter permease subunit [Paenibacillus sp.]